MILLQKVLKWFLFLSSQKINIILKLYLDLIDDKMVLFYVFFKGWFFFILFTLMTLFDVIVKFLIFTI